jgi:hypothetical protein
MCYGVIERSFKRQPQVSHVGKETDRAHLVQNHSRTHDSSRGTLLFRSVSGERNASVDNRGLVWF